MVARVRVPPMARAERRQRQLVHGVQQPPGPRVDSSGQSPVPRCGLDLQLHAGLPQDPSVRASMLTNAARSRIPIDPSLALSCVCSEEIPREYARKVPLCMDQLRRIFATARIPDVECDRIETYSGSRHVVVMYHNQVFAFDVLDENNNAIPAEEYATLRIGGSDLALMLWLLLLLLPYCTGSCDSCSPFERTQHRPTAFHRSACSRPRIAPRGLRRARRSSASRRTSTFSRRSIERCSWCASMTRRLRRPMTLLGSSSTLAMARTAGSIRPSRSYARYLSLACCHEVASTYRSALLQVVCKNGIAGVNGEHTPQDAPAPARVCDIALGLETPEQYEALAAVQDDPPEHAHRKLAFDVSELDPAIFDRAKQNVARLIDSVEVSIREFNGFGAQAMKAAGASPDCFVQMALQLAYYKLHNKVCATYETAATRQFRYARAHAAAACWCFAS